MYKPRVFYTYKKIFVLLKITLFCKIIKVSTVAPLCHIDLQAVKEAQIVEHILGINEHCPRQSFRGTECLMRRENDFNDDDAKKW